eukprot:CAMPEP_0194125488 /NCGR_PEP_ID=MMETSP0150-20130528/59488_1 /TAXON_ID=122233 /ORGANISM="Chaetoceros debilis, Strain MM31A-1" /LENGTH=663 /DNA_ID=CAMNT_0038819299 /DNA_START=805 /DNA_END=2795 /DNA_ORIENTATION=-
MESISRMLRVVFEPSQSMYEEDQRDDMQMRDMSRAPPSNRTLGSRGSGTGAGAGAGTHTKSSSRPTTLRKTSSRSGNKSKMDLTRPDSDSSFELFAQLIVSHIEPKVTSTNDNDEYILEAGDISYLDAIIPATLRLPFVEAVRVRNDDLIERDVMPEEANPLEQAVIKCDEFGLGMDEMDNFLLGGGEKLPGGRIRIKLYPIEEEYGNDMDQHEDINMDPEALIAAAMKMAEKNSKRDLAKKTKTATATKQSSEREAKTKLQLKSQSQQLSQQVAAEERDILTPLAPTMDSNNNGNSNSEDPMGWLTQSGLSEDQREMIRMAMTPKAGHKKSHNFNFDNDITNSNRDRGAMPKNIVDPPGVGHTKQKKKSHNFNFDNDITNSNRDRGAMPKNIVDPLLSGTPSKNKPKIQIEMMGMKKPAAVANKQKSNRSNKSGKSRKKKNSLSAAMSVYSVTGCDQTVVAFVDEWRDGMGDIFSHGVCHPALLLSFFAPVFALGQVMTRLKLNWVGSIGTKDDTNAIFFKFGTIVLSWISLNVLSIVSFQFRYMNGVLGSVEIFAMVMINMFMYTFCVFATGNTRNYMRQVYNIHDVPGTDYLVSAVYMPFTIAQMLRHTADYNQLEAYMFTTTGLFDGGGDFEFLNNVHSYSTYNSPTYDDETSIVSSLA